MAVSRVAKRRVRVEAIVKMYALRFGFSLVKVAKIRRMSREGGIAVSVDSQKELQKQCK